MAALTRRDALRHSATVAALLAASGAWPALAARPQAAFDAKSLAEAVKLLGAAAPMESREVSIGGPDIAENGAAVQVTLGTTLPGAKRLLLLVEKNPSALTAVFHLGDGVEPSLNTRIKMDQSSNVYAVALLADGRAFYAVREIKVTIGGCGA